MKVVVAGRVYCSIAQKMGICFDFCMHTWCGRFVFVCLKCQHPISIGLQLVLGLQCILGCDAANRTWLRAVFYVR